ncbi:MAG: AsmA-like C-terminal region-containing protein [Bacteroidota bacterium]
MKRIRKVLFWSAGTLLGLIIALLILGYLFEDKIHLYAIRQLGKSLNARIEVDDTHVSFLKNWPAVNVELEGLRINPVDRDYPYDVISVASANFRIDFWSVFTDRYAVSGVSLEQPEMILLADENGELNLADMFRPTRDRSARSDSTDVHFALERVHLYDGRFIYEDLHNAVKIDLDSIQLNLRGDLSAGMSELDTDFGLRIDRWENGGMTWVRNKHLAADLKLDAVFGEGESYKVRTGEVRIASLVLDLRGQVQREGRNYALDLAYATNENSFASFMSLLPGGLLDTGREYDYSGDFRVDGWLRGLAGPQAVPDIGFTYHVANGSFQYTGFDARLSDVGLQGNFLYDADAPEACILRVDDFRARLSEKQLTGQITYQDFARPRLQMALKGDIGLDDVRDFYPRFAEQSQMQGEVSLDLQIEGRIADFKAKRYPQIKAIGNARFTNLRLEDANLAYPIEQLNGDIQLDNRHVQVRFLAGKVGQSDFRIQGTVTDYLPRLFGDEARVRGRVELLSDRLLVDEWLRADPPVTATETAPKDRFAFRLPRGMDLAIRANVGEFHLADFHATQVTGDLHLHDQQLKLHQLTLNSLEGAMQVAGSLKVLTRDRCAVRLDARINDINVHQACRSFRQLAAFALVEDNLFGRFSGDVHLSGELDQYLGLDPATLVSYGTVELRDGQLKDFEPLEGLAGFVKLEELRDVRFSDVRTGFRIEEEYFYVPKLKVQANRYKLEMVGRHGFDNRLDYKVYVELPRKEARRTRNVEVLEYIETDAGDPIKVVIPVRITGTVDHPKYKLEGQYLANNVKTAVKKQGEDIKVGWETEMEDMFGKQDNTQVDDLIVVAEDKADTAKKPLIPGLKLKNPLKKLRLPKIGKKGER